MSYEDPEKGECGMNIVQALAIVNDCVRIKKLVGMNADYPYTVEQIAEAAQEMHRTLSAELTHVKDQLSAAQAQLRAANARAAKAAKSE